MPSSGPEGDVKGSDEYVLPVCMYNLRYLSGVFFLLFVCLCLFPVDSVEEGNCFFSFSLFFFIIMEGQTRCILSIVVIMLVSL